MSQPTNLQHYIARTCHEANRVYCLSLGDTSQKPWEEAPQWQRDSAVAGVVAVMAEGLGPEQTHQRWLEHKLTNGWVYGEKKDETLKTHPCIKPYQELPVDQRRKEHLFQVIVKAYTVEIK